MNNLYLKSKTIHRIAMLLTIILALAMSVTGIFLKYVGWSIKMGINLGMIRYIHNNLSSIFSVVLFVMIISGLVLYVVPIRAANKRKS